MPTRQLVFADGSSNKFWNIELDGQSHTVTFGRVGTAGQTQTKEFGDSAGAQKSFDKLVEQKIKKGYVDTGTPAVSKPGKSPAGRRATQPKGAKAGTATGKPQAEPESDFHASADDVDLTVTHVIDLEPRDWFRAGFRKREPLERGAPPDADIDAAEKRLAELKTAVYGWRLLYERLALGPVLAREEAQFWLYAMTGNPGRLETKAAVSKYAKKIRRSTKFDGNVSLADAKKRVCGIEREAPEPLMVALFSLFAAEDCLEIVLSSVQDKQRSYAASNFTLSLNAGFATHVLPFLGPGEITKLQKRVRKTFDPKADPPDHYSAFPLEHYAAAILGMHDELYEAIAGWEDDRYANAGDWAERCQRPQTLLFGLGSAELVESEWRRLRLKIDGPEEARGFLACTEFSALDFLADCICEQAKKDESAALLKVLCLVRAPEAAEPILQCRLSSKSPALARDWMDRYVGNSVAGLMETAGKKGKLADAAIDYLRGVKRSGYEEVIASCVNEGSKQSDGAGRVAKEVLEHEEKVYAPLDAATTPKWLKEALASTDVAKLRPLPPWASPANLPPLVLDGHRLRDEMVQMVLQVLAITPVAEKHPLLVAIKQNIDKHVRDEFIWSLFQLWQEDGSIARQKWAMGAIGHIGDDGCVLKLTPLVRVWPGESQHARAVFGLECLRGVGSSTALMQLSGIAQKLKFKGLKTKAATFVDEIAKEKGMTRAELEDRVIPDCGLDEMGRREFSFGPRSFSFVLGGDLKPMVRDEAGKVRPSLPKPGVKDDEATANASLGEWKLVKKQIKDVAALQAGRLEQAMVTGRRWSVDDFETLLVRHPLLTHLVQKVIWGSFDGKGNRLSLFRVSEERDYADARDDSMSLADADQVGLMHPLDLSEAERAAWGEVLSDYEIISPFPQLGREVYSLEKGEEEASELERFQGMSLAAPTMVFTLEKLGWTRGQAMDAGCFDEHSKQFGAADVTAVVHYEGTVGMGYIDPEEMLKTESIHFCKGMRVPSAYGWGSEKTMKLGTVPAIVISEVMADLQVLKSKAK